MGCHVGRQSINPEATRSRSGSLPLASKAFDFPRFSLPCAPGRPQGGQRSAVQSDSARTLCDRFGASLAVVSRHPAHSISRGWAWEGGDANGTSRQKTKAQRRDSKAP